MENNILYDTNCSIYPGSYVPLLKAEEVEKELKRLHKYENNLLPVNVTELADSFKVEVAIPGLKREDFFIRADENDLSVCVVHKKCGLTDRERFQLHEFNYECLDRHITLPQNADAEFISAEYKGGILCLYVPKAKQPVKNQHTMIVVY